MLLSQQYLHMVKILSICFLACFATCQETENTGFSQFSKRAVTEHQLLNDRGRVLQGLKRLMWLHNAMEGVHTASGRDISQAHIMWTPPKNQDLSDFYDSMSREETPVTMKQLLLGLLEKESPFAVLRKTNVLQYLKNVKGSKDMQELSDLSQAGEQDGKRNLSAQM
ncbi:parathyroid hormone 4-like [Varanus komodoensis]|uniref:parathyroid hormone 4-like n=1 Tax=Varanus komodoensis TaxID=61221 RepID=UPI001CF7BDB6|nr:parathyroid hormone 4-like [Varanus komodoensis]